MKHKLFASCIYFQHASGHPASFSFLSLHLLFSLNLEKYAFQSHSSEVWTRGLSFTFLLFFSEQ